MSEINVVSSSVGNALTQLLMAEDIEPGDPLSYETAKIVWLWHPLGRKIVEGPITMAQSQPREIAIPRSPEDRCRDQFERQWEDDKCDDVIYNLCAVARAYGIGSIGLKIKDVDDSEPVDWKKLWKQQVSFSVFDPLNTAGSLVLNQDPNALDFMKVTTIAVSGRPYHRSRSVTLMNERPVYIAYTTSAFGFVGRSVFQRALFPLKSFVQTMITDDLVTRKAGVFILKIGSAGAIIDQIMQGMAALKRFFVKVATNGNVISVGKDEDVETLNMQNLDKAFGMARQDVLENIATAVDMPAILLKQETFAEGFGEGTEDAKMVAGFVEGYRKTIRPVYSFMDRITMHRAWNPDFYAAIQAEFPEEYGAVRYEDAFYQWQQSFKAQWPNLITEPDSEKVKTDDVKLKAIIATVEVFGPLLDPENVATLMGWAQDNINENKIMFQSPLLLNLEDLATYVKPMPAAEEPNEPKPFAANDSAGKRRRGRRLDASELSDLVSMMEKTDPAAVKASLNGHLNGHAAP
jgi:Protein of unknown function (DUF1073)